MVRTLAVLTLLIAFSWQAKAQDLTDRAQLQDIALRIEVKTDKRTYVVGETVRFTAILRNSGTTPAYISKSFGEAAGGIAGFYVSIQQLTGKTSGKVCDGYGDRFISKDSRTPEQVLREDYLALPPGGLVGFEAKYEGCAVKNPGRYRISATYSAQDLFVNKAKLAVGERNRVAIGQFRSRRSTFRVLGSE
jgi:hypothetical protein